MTNREWLNSLSNEDFVSWLFDNEFYEENGFEQPSPKLNTISRSYTSSKLGLEKWLNEKREVD